MRIIAIIHTHLEIDRYMLNYFLFELFSVYINFKELINDVLTILM